MQEQTKKELLKIVDKNYQEIAKHFSNTREKYIWPELIKLADSIDNGKVLDVGCGSGRICKLFENKNIQYTGIDSCKELLSIAKEKNTFDNCKFEEGNILDLNQVHLVNFDYVFCIAVLHHIPSEKLQINALKQLRNKVSKDGEIILTVWNFWPQAKFRKLIFKFLALRIFKKNEMDFGDILFDWKNPKSESYSKRYYHAFTQRQLKKLVKKAGLNIKQFYKDKYNYYLILNKTNSKK